VVKLTTRSVPAGFGLARRSDSYAVGILGGVSPDPPTADRDDPFGSFEGDPATPPARIQAASSVS